MNKLLANCAIAAAACIGLMITGCSKPKDDTAKKLEEMQKQLDETKKQLDAAKGDAGGAAAPAGAPAASPAARGEQKAGAAQSGAGWGDTAPAAAPPPPAPPKTYTLAAGTPVVVRTVGAVSTKTSASGSTFEATLSEPLIVDGHTVAAKGATVECVVTNADPGGRVKGVATIVVAARSVALPDGRRLAIKTGSLSHDAKKSKGKDAMKVGIASGVGAAIGAIAGGGKGAAIGAGVGAAGGTGVVMATRGEPATIPAETVLTFKLSAPSTVKESRQ
jgi:hypothetical protein